MISKIKTWLIVAGGAFAAVAIFAARIIGQSEGRKLEKADQLKKQKEIQNEYDEIDSGKPDLDDSLERLRNRK